MARYEVKINLWCEVEAGSKQEAKEKAVEALCGDLHGNHAVTEAWAGQARGVTED